MDDPLGTAHLSEKDQQRLKGSFEITFPVPEGTGSPFPWERAEKVSMRTFAERAIRSMCGRRDPPPFRDPQHSTQGAQFAFQNRQPSFEFPEAGLLVMDSGQDGLGFLDLLLQADGFLFHRRDITDPQPQRGKDRDRNRSLEPASRRLVRSRRNGFTDSHWVPIEPSFRTPRPPSSGSGSGC